MNFQKPEVLSLMKEDVTQIWSCQTLIMQKDLLAELNLPELDLKSLKNVIIQNSARLACLIKENNECLNQSKTLPEHLKEVVEPMLSDSTPIAYPKSTHEENIETQNRKSECKKSPVPTDEGLESPAVASSPTQECITECTNQSAENSPSSYNSPNNGISNTAPNFRSSETHNLNDDISSSPSEEKKEVQLPTNTPSVVSFSLCPGVSILKRNICNVARLEDAVESATVKDSSREPGSTSDFEKGSEPALCVISEVIGNAVDAFSGAESTQENSKETSGIQLITPKKTDDITKIKGWRRKQFLVEKPTTVEFYSIAKDSPPLKEKVKLKEIENKDIAAEKPENVENAFVCDSLDDFLDREAELNIGYEIPHLYAEFGIKLTREEVVSKPNLPEEDIKEVETRYCVPVSLPSDNIDLYEIKEEDIKGIKRPIEDDTKHCKLLKLDDNKKQPVKSGQNVEDKVVESVQELHTSDELKKAKVSVRDLNQPEKNSNEIKLVSKLIALVVYPGPYAAMHPIVQYHLDKIRSFRTKVDKYWADFAASSVLSNKKPYQRKILPAFCCAKIRTNSVVNSCKINEELVQKKINCVPGTSKSEHNSNKKDKLPFKLKPCSVVLEKLASSSAFVPWCMDHNRYNCMKCGLSKPKHTLTRKHSNKTLIRNDDLTETVTVSPRASFDKKIASLLAKKVRLLKINGDTLKSIDCLKTLTPNTVEFIKLKFVKESFLSGYLNVWYLPPEVPGVKFRAFITFSHTPPVPNAISLKSNLISLINLPKVITEIVSKENTFDSNEYAILHCNGKIWEIHGSLNIAFGKCDKNFEQIFTSSELPELSTLQDIAHDILYVKAVKWWVLDLTQKFSLMEVRIGGEGIALTRKMFIQAITNNLFGYLPFRKSTEGRVLGAFIMKKLLPFILIGPYYLLEANDLVLKGHSSTLPFRYYGERSVNTKHPLKFFINSVIKNMEKSEKILEGIWLYDKMCLDNTSYIEVVTSTPSVPPQRKYSSIDIEHGYSLSSLTNSSSPCGNPGVIKRKDGREEYLIVTVYLYFDIFDLGFVEGELQYDNSVIISHPLDKRTKMKSHKIGDWFLGIIKKRIEFIPKDLVVRWFITKHKEDLRDRRPFDKVFLSSPHVLTKNGVFYLLEMSESKLEKLGLDKNVIVKAIAQRQIFSEVKELKNLSDLVSDEPNACLSMHEVLFKAANEIKNLRIVQKVLQKEKKVAEEENLDLCSSLIVKLNECSISSHLKLKILEKLEPLFKNHEECFENLLISCPIGRKYLNLREKNFGRMNAEADDSKSFKQNKKKTIQLVRSSANRETQEGVSLAVLNVAKNTISEKDMAKFSISHQQIEKVGSSHSSTPANALNSSTSVAEFLNENGEKDKTKSAEHVVGKSPNIVPKNLKFSKLTSSDLPENIKLCWKNWNVNNVEVK